MSDDEEYEEEEVENEEEEEDNKSVKSAASSAPEPLKYKRSLSTRTDTVDESNLNEAEKAMIASKKRHDDDEAIKIQEYEARRRNEREKEEEELRILKEKQEQRRIQREEEEREQAERRMQEEERRRVEEEERKARIEEERKKKEDAIKKRQQLMGAQFVPSAAGAGGRNFVIPEKKDKGDKFGNIVQAKQEMGLTIKQQDDAKQTFLATLVKALDISDFSGDDLKGKLKEMHQRICKLETEKYDLEKRHERQEYDLKELNARQSQIVRNRAINKGVDPSEISSRYPPKISVASKYDRQTDRGNFTERRKKFDKKGAFPCFPNVPPPTTILEFKLAATEEEDE